jgi:hypothetical protein
LIRVENCRFGNFASRVRENGSMLRAPDKKRPDRLVQAGIWLRTNGDYRGARLVLENARMLDPDSATIRELISNLDSLEARQAQAARANEASTSESRPSEAPVDTPSVSTPPMMGSETVVVDGAAREVAPPPGATKLGAPKFHLEVIEGPALGLLTPVLYSQLRIGSGECGLQLPARAGIASHHATIVVRQGKLYLRDELGSPGVFVAITKDERLGPKASFRLGRRRFVYEELALDDECTDPGKKGPKHVLHELDANGQPDRSVVIAAPLFTLGRGRCDLAFPQDDNLAVQHAVVMAGPSAGYLSDCSEGRGTFMRINPGADVRLKVGDRFAVGEVILKVGTLG